MSDIEPKVALTYMKGLVTELPEEDQKKVSAAYQELTQAVQSITAVHGNQAAFMAYSIKFLEMQIQN